MSFLIFGKPKPKAPALQKKLSECTDTELLKNFRSEYWSQLKEDKRISVLQEVENRNAAAQGRKPCMVCSTDDRSVYGAYYSDSQVIEVNVGSKDVPGVKMLDTVYHEGQHAYQHKCVLDGTYDPKQNMDQVTLDMCGIEERPYNYSKNIAYDNCTMEVNSNVAAYKKVKENSAIFADDPGYEKYLENREARFAQFSRSHYLGDIYSQQKQGIEEAYSRGDITEDKKKEMTETVDSYLQRWEAQPMFSEMARLRNEIQNERIALNQKNNTTNNNGQNTTDSDDISDDGQSGVSGSIDQDNSPLFERISATSNQATTPESNPLVQNMEPIPVPIPMSDPNEVGNIDALIMDSNENFYSGVDNEEEQDLDSDEEEIDEQEESVEEKETIEEEEPVEEDEPVEEEQAIEEEEPVEEEQTIEEEETVEEDEPVEEKQTIEEEETIEGEESLDDEEEYDEEEYEEEEYEEEEYEEEEYEEASYDDSPDESAEEGVEAAPGEDDVDYSDSYDNDNDNSIRR